MVPSRDFNGKGVVSIYFNGNSDSLYSTVSNKISSGDVVGP